MNKSVLQALAFGVSLGALGSATAAWASDAPATANDAAPGASTGAQQDPATGDAPAGADIVVTAQKRSEKLRDVPLSITAFTERNIEQQGITNIEDYAARSPGVHISRDGTQSSFSIRGIASATTAETTSATAGIYVDDYPIYDTWFRFTSPDLRLFDVARIEVLRGPQGTLYGATSLSGSIRVITNKPDLGATGAKFEGTLSTTDGGGTNYAANGMVNVPLVTDKLGVRAVGYVRKDSGYIDNPVQGETNINETRVYGGRFYLSAQPNETLNLLASVTYQHDAQDDQSATYYFPPAGRTISQWKSDLPVRTRSELFIAALSADQELGSGNLTVTATYGENKSRNVGDGTPFATIFGVPVKTPYYQPSNSRTKIVEARYTSGAGGPFRYVIGAYYNSRYRDFEQTANQAALAPIYGTGRIYDVHADQTATEMAIFGEATWAFAEKWEATVGLRGFKNKYHFTSDVSGLLNSPVAPLTLFVTDVRNTQSDYTPRFSLAYKPVPQVNIYATASKGYRFGLTNYNSGANGGTPLTYKSDTLWNYELGVKASLFGGRGSFNTTAYYVTWSDIQLSFRNANGQAYITNAGDARSFGLESEFAFRPSKALEMNAALSLGNAELTKGNPGIQRRAASARGAAVIGVLDGDRLPGSQKLSASGGIQYNVEGIGSGTGYVRLDDVYVGASYVDFMQQGSLRIGDYNLVNLRLGYKAQHFEVTLFADNLFNNRGVVNAVPNADLIGLTDAAYRVRPRTIGVTFRGGF